MTKKHCLILALILLIFISGCSSVSASPAARIVSGVVTKVVSTIFKRLWSMKSTAKTAAPSRSMMKFESGYTVETVFDGSKHGIEPYAVEISTAGEIFVLDSDNSNIYKIPSPLTRYSRPKLLAGSAEGYSGHVDGKLRQARMNRPKGLAVDDGGNIYVADTVNMAIRKISDNGVVTIAGGKSGRGGAHVDGPSEDAKFSDDFDVVYIGSSCSILVVDRGNRAIREIQLHEDDCSRQDDDNLTLGIAVLAAACFFGYMLALLQGRIWSMLSYDNEPTSYAKSTPGMPPAPYQRPPPQSAYPPLIPPENEYEKQDESLFISLGRLFSNTGSSIVDLLGGLFSGFSKKPSVVKHSQLHHPYATRPWPAQESFVIPHEDAPPPIDPRDPTPRKSYPPTTKDLDKPRQYKQNRNRSSYYNGGDYTQHRHMSQSMHWPTSPRTDYYEPQGVETNEIVFGAVQEQQEDGRRREAMVVKAVEYEEPVYDNEGVRSRHNYMSYSSYGY